MDTQSLITWVFTIILIAIAVFSVGYIMVILVWAFIKTARDNKAIRADEKVTPDNE